MPKLRGPRQRSRRSLAAGVGSRRVRLRADRLRRATVLFAVRIVVFSFVALDHKCPVEGHSQTTGTVAGDLSQRDYRMLLDRWIEALFAPTIIA